MRVTCSASAGRPLVGVTLPRFIGVGCHRLNVETVHFFDNTRLYLYGICVIIWAFILKLSYWLYREIIIIIIVIFHSFFQWLGLCPGPTSHCSSLVLLWSVHFYARDLPARPQTPNLEDQGIIRCATHHTRFARQGWPYQELRLPPP